MLSKKIPYKGLCSVCAIEAEQRGEVAINDVWIVNKKPPLCQFHKQRKKSSKQINKKSGGKEKEPFKESDTFNDIWTSRPKKSFVTDKLLPDTQNARAWYFSHILPKGKAKYPMFKFYKKNIQLMTFQEHETWEYKKYTIKEDAQWKHVFELEEELKQEYIQHKKDYEDGKADYYKS